MRRFEIPSRWRFFLIGFLTGILVSGIFYLFIFKPNPEIVSQESHTFETIENQSGTLDENPINEGKININLATADELMTLPGIGPVKAASIIAFRDKYGAFENVEELLYVPGIGEEQLIMLKPLIAIQ